MTENRVVVYYMNDASFLYLLINPLHDFETLLSVFTFFFVSFLFALPCALNFRICRLMMMCRTHISEYTSTRNFIFFTLHAKERKESKRREALVLFLYTTQRGSRMHRGAR